MRSKIVYYMIHRYSQMLEKGLLASFLVVERNLLIQNREISRFLYICHSTKYQPTRVIIEAASDIIIATLSQRLVLMIASSDGLLCRGYINNSLTCTCRYLMYESNKVLVGIPESHSPADATFEETGRTAHTERYHTLILIPDIYHTV